MSALLAHAKAYRALGEALGEAAAECGDEAHGLLLARLSQAHIAASADLEGQARAECGGNPEPSIPAQIIANKRRRG